jgi:hypothetical protein
MQLPDDHHLVVAMTQHLQQPAQRALLRLVSRRHAEPPIAGWR